MRSQPQGDPIPKGLSGGQSNISQGLMAAGPGGSSQGPFTANRIAQQPVYGAQVSALPSQLSFVGGQNYFPVAIPCASSFGDAAVGASRAKQKVALGTKKATGAPVTCELSSGPSRRLKAKVSLGERLTSCSDICPPGKGGTGVSVGTGIQQNCMCKCCLNASIDNNPPAVPAPPCIPCLLIRFLLSTLFGSRPGSSGPPSGPWSFHFTSR